MLKNTTVKDFSGGWNVADNDLNLSSKYQPVSDNVLRGADGSIVVRPGYALKSDFADGTETSFAAASYTFTTVDTQAYIDITWAAHPFSSGDHITLSGCVDVGGITASALNKTHGVLKIDANTVRIAVDEAATSSTSAAMTNVGVVRDTHTLSGNIIHQRYFNRRMVCFTDIGEIGTFEPNGTLSCIWNFAAAEALSTGLLPTRACRHWSSDAFKSTLIACNGYDRDKPVQIDAEFNVEYLVDKATFSNAAVPKADYVVCMQGYVIFIRTENGSPYIELSAKGTDGTFSRDPSPADAVELDLSLVTSSVEPVLLGGGRLRDKLYLAFYDRGMLGTLGVYTTGTPALHEPDFADTIAEHGVVSHHTIVSLGNDIFMCDYAGVPSVTISSQSGLHVPVRLSELISPVMSKHLARLEEDTLRDHAFAVYDKQLRAYMLFVPKYDETPVALGTDPIQFNEALRGSNRAIVLWANHGLIDRSYITLSGAITFNGLDAADINGTREVVSIIDDNTVIVQLGGRPSEGTTAGGGSSVIATPVNDETIVYVFEFNRELGIKRWTRFRDWNFDCAAVTQRGKLMLAKGTKLYQMGHPEEPIHADAVNEDDGVAWANATAYAVGARITDGIIYECVVAHTSPASGTFAEARATYPTYWEEYIGRPISWEVETPWSDMQTRGYFKNLKYIHLDAIGEEQFTVSGFTNQIYRDPETNELIPARTMTFVAQGGGGYNQVEVEAWGGGRRTRDKKVWPFPLRPKTLRWRFSGDTRHAFKLVSLTMHYSEAKLV